MIQRSAGRRRRLRKVERGTHTNREWLALCDRYGWRCLCCGETGVVLEKDHIRPLSRGGTNTIDNIQVLCGPCNRRKGARYIDYRSDVTEGDNATDSGDS